jgi:hypothetical protein
MLAATSWGGLGARAWNSPTITTWLLQGAQSLQIFLIAPLILHHFDQVTAAAWFLFSSINFFGVIVMQRVMLTFSRMISMQVGGRKVLLPLRHITGTMGFFQISLVLVNVLVASFLGWFSLSPIISGYQDASHIWLAFWIFQAGSAFTFFVSRYHAILMGFNAVAVSNRWNFFTLSMGLIVVASVISFGFGVVWAALASQTISLIGGLLVRRVIPRITEVSANFLDELRLDPAVARQAITPIWQSMIMQCANMGVLPIAAMIVAGTGNIALAAPFAFATRLMSAVEQIATAPFNSVQPFISQQMAAGNLRTVHHLLHHRMILMSFLYAGGLLTLGLGTPLVMKWIHSQISFIDFTSWMLLGLGLFLSRLNICFLAPFISINRIPFYWESLLQVVLGAALIHFFLKPFGLLAVGGAIIFSVIVSYRLQPYRLYRKFTVSEKETHKP